MSKLNTGELEAICPPLEAKCSFCQLSLVWINNYHTTASISVLTLHQLVQARDLLAAVQRVQRPDSLREVHVVRQGPRQLHEQRIQGPEAVAGDGEHHAFKVFVSIAVEAHFSSFLLGGERLERARAVEAAVRAVRRAGDQTVAPGARLAPGAGVGPRRPVRLVSLLEVFELDTSA